MQSLTDASLLRRTSTNLSRLRPTNLSIKSVSTSDMGSRATSSTSLQGPHSSETSSPAPVCRTRQPPRMPRRRKRSASSSKLKTGSTLRSSARHVVNTSNLSCLTLASSQYGLWRTAAPIDRLTSCDAWLTRAILSRAWERSEEHTSELQSRQYLVCRLLL